VVQDQKGELKREQDCEHKGVQGPQTAKPAQEKVRHLRRPQAVSICVTDHKARQDEEEIHEQETVFNECAVPQVKHQRQMKNAHKNGADTAYAVESDKPHLETHSQAGMPVRLSVLKRTLLQS